MSRDCHVVSIKLISDHDNIYHVPMTCMVLEICGKIHTSEFSTHVALYAHTGILIGRKYN